MQPLCDTECFHSSLHSQVSSRSLISNAYLIKTNYTSSQNEQSHVRCSSSSPPLFLLLSSLFQLLLWELLSQSFSLRLLLPLTNRRTDNSHSHSHGLHTDPGHTGLYHLYRILGHVGEQTEGVSCRELDEGGRICSYRGSPRQTCQWQHPAWAVCGQC